MSNDIRDFLVGNMVSTEPEIGSWQLGMMWEAIQKFDGPYADGRQMHIFLGAKIRSMLSTSTFSRLHLSTYLQAGVALVFGWLVAGTAGIMGGAGSDAVTEAKSIGVTSMPLTIFSISAADESFGHLNTTSRQPWLSLCRKVGARPV